MNEGARFGAVAMVVPELRAALSGGKHRGAEVASCQFALLGAAQVACSQGPARPDDNLLTVDGKTRIVDLQMTEYLVTKQGAYADWGSNAEGEIQEMPLSKPDGEGWKLHSVIPTQYNVMAVWEREVPAKAVAPEKPRKQLPAPKRR